MVFCESNFNFNPINFDENIFGFQNSFSNFSMQFISNGYVSVDSFFLISGTLLSYLTLKELDKIKGRVWTPIFWPMFYIHRYLRYVVWCSQLLKHLDLQLNKYLGILSMHNTMQFYIKDYQVHMQSSLPFMLPYLSICALDLTVVQFNKHQMVVLVSGGKIYFTLVTLVKDKQDKILEL